MDDDGGAQRVARAGRRAARNMNTWAEDTEGAPAPAEQGFFAPAAEHGTPSMQSNLQAERSSEAPNGQQSPDREPSSAGPSYEDRSSADPLINDDGKKFVGISRRKAEQLSKGDEETNRRNQKYEEKSHKEAILEIPELEEEGKEDLSRLVAEAPKVRTNRVQGMSELEDDMHYKLPPSDDRDIDLSLLTAVLCSSEQVAEADAVWDPELIFTEVASAINSEREKAEGNTEPPDDKQIIGI